MKDTVTLKRGIFKILYRVFLALSFNIEGQFFLLLDRCNQKLRLSYHIFFFFITWTSWSTSRRSTRRSTSRISWTFLLTLWYNVSIWFLNRNRLKTCLPTSGTCRTPWWMSRRSTRRSILRSSWTILLAMWYNISA